MDICICYKQMSDGSKRSLAIADKAGIQAAAEPDGRVSRKFRKNWGPRMYQYDQYDQTIVDERVAQYADQVRRRLSGELSEEEFRPLRLQNGLYYQRHAYMLTLTLEDLAAGEAQRWVDASQPSLLMIGEAFAARQTEAKHSSNGMLVAA